jgi:hypothetical protein
METNHLDKQKSKHKLLIEKLESIFFLCLHQVVMSYDPFIKKFWNRQKQILLNIHLNLDGSEIAEQR